VEKNINIMTKMINEAILLTISSLNLLAVTKYQSYINISTLLDNTQNILKSITRK
jgi:hypothetical protein